MSVDDVIYTPIYEAILAGLGVGGLIIVVCFALCALGLYLFLALTEPWS